MCTSSACVLSYQLDQLVLLAFLEGSKQDTNERSSVREVIGRKRRWEGGREGTREEGGRKPGSRG